MEIDKIVQACKDIVDPSFCTYESCIHEVPLFKWREKILGCTDLHLLDDVSDEMRVVVDRYSHKTMPEEMDKYLRVYESLSQRLIDNT